MSLVIRAIAVAGDPLTPPITGYFGEDGGTIGRSHSTTLMLPDPKCHISRLQASVSQADGGYAIRNVGSANPITLNARPVSPGESAPLAEGDELQIGPYLLQISILHGAAAEEVRRASAADRLYADLLAVSAAAAAEPRAPLAGAAAEAQRDPALPERLPDAAEPSDSSPTEASSMLDALFELVSAKGARGSRVAVAESSVPAPRPPAERETRPPAEHQPHPPRERQPHPAPERAPHAPPERPPHSRPPETGPHDPQGLSPERMQELGKLLRDAGDALLEASDGQRATRTDSQPDD